MISLLHAMLQKQNRILLWNLVRTMLHETNSGIDARFSFEVACDIVRDFALCAGFSSLN